VLIDTFYLTIRGGTMQRKIGSMFLGVWILIFILTISLASVCHARWQNICPSKDCIYCKNVGKDAYNAFGAKVLREVKLGKIIGISWRSKGSLVSKDGRVSPRNAYYYIIDDGWGPEKAFLRQCREIDAK
jgi:hypothetical protein